jgi:enediyne biosynthesis protein E7
MGVTTDRRLPPGPRGHPILGALPAFRSDIVKAIVDGWREYGDVVAFRGRGPMILVAHPDHVQHVMQDRHQNYPHPKEFNQKFKCALGEGLITSEGEYWLRHRRMMQPAFHRNRITAFADLMVESTHAMLERWRPRAERGEPLEVRSEMMRVTLSILARALFSTDWTEDAPAVEPAVTTMLGFLDRRLLSMIDLPESVPTSINRAFVQARETLDTLIYDLIKERRRSGEDAGDLLSMLLQARDEETGEGMTDQQVRDEVITIIIAGHETVSSALTWTWYLLSRHAEAGRRLREELATVLAGRSPGPEDLPGLQYTTMVLEESMRLYPPLWLLSRSPVEGDEIGGYHIPAGCTVFVCPFVTHRHPAVWDNPEGFAPERFSPESSAGRPRYGYFPFAGGPRRCIGLAFGMMEMQIIVAMVAQRYRLDLVPGHPIALQSDITLRPRHGMMMTAKPCG